MNCDVISSQLTDYIKSELTADETSVVARHLESCESCRKIEAETRKSFGLFRLVPAETPGAEVWDRIVAEIDRDEAADKPLAAIRGGRGSRLSLVAVAAATLLAVGVTVFLTISGTSQPPAREVARLERLGDGAVAKRVSAGSRVPVLAGQPVLEGESLATEPGAGAIFSIPNVGRFRLAGGSQVRFVDARTLLLESGELIADVTPSGRNFTIRTSLAQATVLGTLFRVHAAADRTALTVARGMVNFANDRGTVPVPGGSQSIAFAGAGPIAPLPIDAADWDLFRSVAPGPEVRFAFSGPATQGRAPFEIRLSSSDPTVCDTRLSDRTYLILTLQDPSGAVRLVRLAPAETPLSFEGRVSGGFATLDGKHDLVYRGTVTGLTPGSWTVSAMYASAGADDAWGGFAESAAAKIEVGR